MKVTGEVWHMTGDMWHIMHGVGWIVYQKFSSLPLTVWMIWSFEDLEEKDDRLNQSMSEWVTKVFVDQTLFW